MLGKKLYISYIYAFFILMQTFLFAQIGTFNDEPIVVPSDVRSNYTDSDNQSIYSIDNDNFVYINQYRVNLRSGPGTQYSVITVLPQNTKGKIIKKQNGWYFIDFGNNRKGWVRSDLVSKAPISYSSAEAEARAAKANKLEKEFSRWDKHLGDTLLNFNSFPSYWTISKAWLAYRLGNYEEAYNLAQEASEYETVRGKYLMAKALYKLGRYEEADSILKKLNRVFEDAAMAKYVLLKAKPYLEEKVVFKFGGFDDIKTYKEKIRKGYRAGLESAEFYRDFVDINTWTWKSKEKYEEFQKIAGIDCSGYVQRVLQSLYTEAGVQYPIQGRTSTRGLWSGEYSVAINPGYRPPPPPEIRPGDMILFDYGHNRYGHSTIYLGQDSKGNIIVTQMGATAEIVALPPEKLQYYKGTYRLKGMDSVRQKILA